MPTKHHGLLKAVVQLNVWQASTAQLWQRWFQSSGRSHALKKMRLHSLLSRGAGINIQDQGFHLMRLVWATRESQTWAFSAGSAQSAQRPFRCRGFEEEPDMTCTLEKKTDEELFLGCARQRSSGAALRS